VLRGNCKTKADVVNEKGKIVMMICFLIWAKRSTFTLYKILSNINIEKSVPKKIKEHILKKTRDGYLKTYTVVYDF
jgi:hypothetical protein